MKLEELRVYNAAMEMGDRVWSIVDNWTYFQKETVGKQLVRAVDSIAANLSEGFGRYHYKEKRNYSYYSRGSLFETKIWLTKAHNRKLIVTEIFDTLMAELEVLGKRLNSYINRIGDTDVSEPEERYECTKNGYLSVDNSSINNQFQLTID